MPTINVVTRDGGTHVVTAEAGISIMEAIRESGQDELQALCGGCCSCATCHVYISPDHAASFAPRDEDEDDLLDSSSYRRPDSRLSCQLVVSEAADGVLVTIAPEDFG